METQKPGSPGGAGEEQTRLLCSGDAGSLQVSAGRFLRAIVYVLKSITPPLSVFLSLPKSWVWARVEMPV